MRTLESRILRKASVRFGEGRTEKCPQRQLAGRLLDFVVTAPSREVLETYVIPKLKAFLAERGLQLSETKTRIVHVDEGFNFLGFEIRRWGRTLLTRPQKEKVLAHLATIKAYLQAHKQKPAAVVIKELGPVIRGWANYYRHCAAKATFQYASHRTWGMLWRWAKRRHPNKSSKWVKARYFRPDGYWTFHAGRAELYRHAATPITRHVKGSGRATPMDPAQRAYWEERRGRQLTRETYQKERLEVLQAQANACALCGIAFGPGDPIDAHHLRPRQAGGGNERANRVLVHRWCHHAYHQRHGYKVAEARAV